MKVAILLGRGAIVNSLRNKLLRKESFKPRWPHLIIRDFSRKCYGDLSPEQDPVLAMLEWVAHQMMQIEAEAKVGAEKGKHCSDRKTYFFGARVRRPDTRFGTLYLYLPKLRRGGYVPFFVTERKRSELALAAQVQISVHQWSVTADIAAAPATGRSSLPRPASLHRPENAVSIIRSWGRMAGEDMSPTSPIIPSPSFQINLQKTPLFTKHPEKREGKDYRLL